MGILSDIAERRKQRKFERETFRLFSSRRSKSFIKTSYSEKKEVGHPSALVEYSKLFIKNLKKKFKRHKKKPSKHEEPKKVESIQFKLTEKKPEIMTPPVERAYKFKEKEIKKFSKVYLGFMFVSLILSVLALIKRDFFSYSIAILILVLDFLCYRQTLAPDKRKYAAYLMAWPFILTLNIASIIEVNLLAFILSIVAMLISVLTPTLITRRVSAENITNYIKVPTKSEAKVETDLDRLLGLLQKLGKMKISEISGTFDIPREKAEQWARIMEENEFAQLRYPPFGEVELVLKEKKSSEEESESKEEKSK